MFKSFVAFIAAFTPSLALAHSGHGHIETTSVWHWLLEVDHIGWIVPVVVVLAVVAGNKVLNRNK